jgi:hypothetical protein
MSTAAGASQQAEDGDATRMSPRRRAIIVASIVATVAAFVLSLPWQVPQERTQSALTAVSGGEGALEVRGGIDANLLICPMRGDCPDVNLWYTFHNRSKNAISGLHVIAIQAPGFQFDDKAAGLAGIAGLKTNLKADEAKGVQASLHPLKGSGRYNVELVYGWTNPSGSELRDALTLGPIEISSWWERAIYNSARRIKDLALPLVLAIFGWWLQNEQKERDAKQLTEQKKRDAKQLREQKRLDDARVVLTTLLPTHVHDTKRYYLPFAARAYQLNERINDVKARLSAPSTPQDLVMAELRCAHAYFAFMKHHRFVVRRIGGVQFSNHRGETIVQQAFRFIALEADGYHIDEELKNRALRCVARRQEFSEFLDVLRNEDWEVCGPLALGTWAVLKWIHDPIAPLAQVGPLLTILQEVLLFEMDLPMELWYQNSRELTTPDVTKAVEDLQPLRKELEKTRSGREPQTDKKLKRYLDVLVEELKTYHLENHERRLPTGD